MQLAAPYARSQSVRTNLDQTTYSFSLTFYCTAVLNRQIESYGLLLAAPNPDTPSEVVLGGSGHAAHPPRLILYVTRML